MLCSSHLQNLLRCCTSNPLWIFESVNGCWTFRLIASPLHTAEEFIYASEIWCGFHLSAIQSLCSSPKPFCRSNVHLCCSHLNLCSAEDLKRPWCPKEEYAKSPKWSCSKLREAVHDLAESSTKCLSEVGGWVFYQMSNKVWQQYWGS